jgi:hypothetical protein
MNEGLVSEPGPISDMIGHEKEYKRSVTEMLRDHNIEIRFLSVGCIIRVGCKEIAFTDRDVAMVELMDYVKDPHTATKKWQKRFDQ